MKLERLLNPLLRIALLCWTVLALALPAAHAIDYTKKPTIWAFNMSGSNQINLGETVDFNWSVSNNTEQLTLEPGVGDVTGTTWVSVKPESTTTYTLTARNRAGAVTSTRKITVVVPPVITSFTATPENLAPGQSARLTWAAPGALYYYVSADVGNDPGRVWGTNVTVRPKATTTYTLTAFNTAGSTTRTLTVPVGAPLPKPAISSFTATPASVLQGDATTLAWSVNGANSLSISPGVGPVTGNSITLTPAASTTYTLTAANASGSTTRAVDVSVVPRPVPLPEVASFTASPATLIRGGSTTLAWNVSGADQVSISGLGVVTGNNVSVAPSESTSYTLTATNVSGSVTRTVSVVVRAPAPVIHTFTAVPATIERGGSTTLSWSVEHGEIVSIAGLGVVTGDSVVVSPTSSTTYTLTVSNESGAVSASTLVTVNIPPPFIQAFQVAPDTITQGESAQLTWFIDGATRVSISGLGDVTGNGVTVTPSQTTTYVLSASNDGGSVTRSVTLTVNLPEPPPTINSFTATPASIALGETTTLAWEVTGAASVALSASTGASPGVVTGDSLNVSPVINTTYTLTARNNIGVIATRSVTVTVTVPVPVIQSFTATPASISPGTSSTLNWSVTGASHLTILADVGASPGNVTGTSLTVSPTQTTTYTLTATNDGGPVTRTVTVTVSDLPPVIGSFVSWPNVIDYGQSTKLYWDVRGAATLVITAERGESPGTVTGAQGNITVTPVVSTLYTMLATSPGGVITRSVTQVTVNAAPPPPVPVIDTFSATPSTINRGDSAALSWTVTGAESLSISPGIGAVTGTSVTVNPTQTTTYTLTAQNQYGPATRTITLNVTQPAPPTINAFTANPGTIPLGGITTLNWTVTGATEVSIAADVGASPGVVTGTSVTVTPAEDTIYTLTARNQYGETTRTYPVVVTGPTAPVIASFAASPAYIESGSGASATLSWNVSGADTISITADQGASPGVVTGTSLSVTPAQTTVYTLSAQNGVGITTMTATVILYTPGNGSVAHPRVWLTPTLVEQLVARARANDPAWIALRDACDQWAAMPVRWPDESATGGTINGGYQYYDYYRPVAELSLGFQVAAQVDPTRAAAYGAKAREIVLKMSDPVRHGRESTDSGWSIRAYVPALALGYDWLYPILSNSDRAQIFSEINRWVEWYDVSGFSRTFPVGNYFAGYYAAKGLGALATEGDNPKADAMWSDWLNRLHFSMVVPYHQAWLTGGSATDGWNYGPNETLNMVRPLVAARTAKGLDLINHAQQPFAYPNGHAHWMAHFTWPDLTSVLDRGFLYSSSNPTPASAAWATHYAGLLRMANGAAAPVAQQYALDLRALPSRDRVEPWVEFLFFDSAAPVQNYRTALSYRTGGDGQVSMRNSWNADTVLAAFQAGPYTGSPDSSEMFYDQGGLTIQRGNVRFVVNAWGEMLRHSPGTSDGEDRDPVSGERPFNQLYTELYGDSVPEGYRQARRLFNTFYSHRTIRDGTITGFFSEIGVGPEAAHTTLSKFEEGGRHVMMRATKLEDLYWDPEPIVKWERSVVYVRPQVFVVYDRTKMSSASVDNWMSWTVANGPELVSNTPAATVFNVVDRRAAYGGNLYRGRMTALLPVDRVVTPVNMFNRSKVHRMEIRPGTPATDSTWVTVFDAAGSELSAGNATALAVSAGNVTTGDVEGAHIAAASGGTNAAVLFSRTGLPVAGAIEFRVPNAETYVIVNDLTPGSSYEIATKPVDGQLSVRVTAGGSRTVSAQGILAFDIAPLATP